MTTEVDLYEQEAAADATTWLREAERIAIDDADTAQAAADWLTEDLAPRRQAVEAFFAPLVKAAHLAHKQLTQRRAEILAHFEAPERIVKQKLADWHRVEQQRRAELEAKAGAARLLLVPEVEQVSGVAFVTRHRAEVVDFPALVRAAATTHPHLLPLLTVDTKKLDAMTRALGAALDIPGVRVVTETGVRRTG